MLCIHVDMRSNPKRINGITSTPFVNKFETLEASLSFKSSTSKYY